MILSIVLPAYNEGASLKGLLPRIEKVLKEVDISSEILVVDTMEPLDETGKICFEFGARWIQRSGGNYFGDAIRTGIQHAKGKYVLMMDADGSHSPDDILRLYHSIITNDADIVVGSRYCKGGDSQNGFLLKLMSWVLNFTYRTVFKLSIFDVSNSFRIYKSALFTDISLTSNNFDIVEEILIRIKKKYPSIRLVEIPIYFDKRTAGKSKRDLLKFIFSYLSSMNRLLKMK